MALWRKWYDDKRNQVQVPTNDSILAYQLHNALPEAHFLRAIGNLSVGSESDASANLTARLRIGLTRNLTV